MSTSSFWLKQDFTLVAARPVSVHSEHTPSFWTTKQQWGWYLSVSVYLTSLQSCTETIHTIILDHEAAMGVVPSRFSVQLPSPVLYSDHVYGLSGELSRNRDGTLPEHLDRPTHPATKQWGWYIACLNTLWNHPAIKRQWGWYVACLNTLWNHPVTKPSPSLQAWAHKFHSDTSGLLALRRWPWHSRSHSAARSVWTVQNISHQSHRYHDTGERLVQNPCQIRHKGRNCELWYF